MMLADGESAAAEPSPDADTASASSRAWQEAPLIAAGLR